MQQAKSLSCPGFSNFVLAGLFVQQEHCLLRCRALAEILQKFGRDPLRL